MRSAFGFSHGSPTNQMSEAEHEDAAQNGDEEHEDDRFAQIYAEREEVRYQQCPAAETDIYTPSV